MSTQLSAGLPANESVRTRGIARPGTRPRNKPTAVAPVAPVAAVEAELNFLVLDSRFGTMIYVILESDPRADREFPGLAVREILLERRTTTPGVTPQDAGVGAGAAIGRDPAHLDRFREFGSDRSVAGAGFILIEPRYVGPSWPAYLSAFRPDGDKPLKRHRETARPARGA